MTTSSRATGKVPEMELSAETVELLTQFVGASTDLAESFAQRLDAIEGVLEGIIQQLGEMGDDGK